MGMRWNGGRQHGIKQTDLLNMGTPGSPGGYPTWFVLPEEVGELIEKNIQLLKKISK